MKAIIEEKISFTKKQIKTIVSDPQKTAEAIDLIYVTDNCPGIIRVKKSESFEYLFKEKIIDDEDELKRIKNLALPPAWENVWICKFSNGHLQATGIDTKKRKQYKYHSLWNKLRNHTKFYRMYEFGKSLPEMRSKLDQAISLKGLPKEKVLATVVCLMENTHIRIGSNFYEKLYGSFGLTTLKDKHVKINNAQLKFSFKGKKGVMHSITLKNKRLALIVQQCKDIPGKELFQYYDENGDRKIIDSGMVNEYIKAISNKDFTAKDFRTWAGTLQALLALKEVGNFETESEKKKNILIAIDKTASELGNTRTVCKKYYINPIILSLYENNKLGRYLMLSGAENTDSQTNLTSDEKVIMKILESDKNITDII